MTWEMVLYAMLGGVMTAVSGGVAALALWGDRVARGFARRRCPKCWFDLSGTPGLQCPECGKTAKREERLFRTRRRWRFAAVGLVGVLMGVALGGWPAWRRTDLVAALPVALQVELWTMAADPEAVFAEIMKDTSAFSEYRKRRMMDGAMRWLVEAPARAAAGMPTPSSRRTALMRRLGRGGAQGTKLVSPEDMLLLPHATWPLGDSGRADLLLLLTDPTYGYQKDAVNTMLWRKDLDERFSDAVRGVALTGREQAAAIRVLRLFAGRDERARATLVEILSTELSSEVRAAAAYSLLVAVKEQPAALAATYAALPPAGKYSILSTIAGSDADAPVLYPQILEEVMSGGGARRISAGAALAKGDASVDALVLEKLAIERGERLMGLIIFVEVRRAAGTVDVRAVEKIEAIAAGTDGVEHDGEVRDAARTVAVRLREWLKAYPSGKGETRDERGRARRSRPAATRGGEGGGSSAGDAGGN